MTEHHEAVRSALTKLDGSDAASVALLTGMSRQELDELGGFPARVTTAPPNGVGFTVFASEPAIVDEVRELVSRAWAQARRCEDCGAESGESCRWPCLGRPEGS